MIRLELNVTDNIRNDIDSFLLKIETHIAIPDFKWQSSKDNFHKVIFRLTKETLRDINSNIAAHLIRSNPSR